MEFSPAIIAIVVVFFIIGGAGAYLVIKDDTPTAD